MQCSCDNTRAHNVGNDAAGWECVNKSVSHEGKRIEYERARARERARAKVMSRTRRQKNVKG